MPGHEHQLAAMAIATRPLDAAQAAVAGVDPRVDEVTLADAREVITGDLAAGELERRLGEVAERTAVEVELRPLDAEAL